MIKLIFTPKDNVVAKMAQVKFDQWYEENIEKATIVYGGHYPQPTTIEYDKWTLKEKLHLMFEWTEVADPRDTHTARLVCLEEIK